MIPKIIHYCWLSSEAYPKIVEKCMASWKKHLPDYKFVLWNTETFDIDSTLWTKQAFETKKYAFAADYIRLHAIYHHGGIYLDTDVEVLKNFDDLLDLPYFIGKQFDDLIEAGVLGAEKGANWIRDCMAYYEKSPFIKENGEFHHIVMPTIMQSEMEKTKDIKHLESNDLQAVSKLLENHQALFLFPSDYFSPKNYQTAKISMSKNTYTIHHYNGAWLPYIHKIRLKLMRLIGIRGTENLIRYLGLRRLTKIVRTR